MLEIQKSTLKSPVILLESQKSKLKSPMIMLEIQKLRLKSPIIMASVMLSVIPIHHPSLSLTRPYIITTMMIRNVLEKCYYNSPQYIHPLEPWAECKY